MTTKCPVCENNCHPAMWICFECYHKLCKWLLRKGICNVKSLSVSEWREVRDKYLEAYLHREKERVEFT